MLFAPAAVVWYPEIGLFYRNYFGFRPLVAETKALLVGEENNQFNQWEQRNPKYNVSNDAGAPVIGERLTVFCYSTNTHRFFAHTLSVEERQGVAGKCVSQPGDPACYRYKAHHTDHDNVDQICNDAVARISFAEFRVARLTRISIK